MSVLWVLLAAIIARLSSAMPARALAAVLAVAGGLTLPDTDQWLPLLHHRSAITHSALPTLLVLATGFTGARSVAAGVALGVGFHLAADCFPAAMVGYATIKLPVAGSIGSAASYGWLAANSLACSGWGAWALARQEPPGWAIGVLVVSAWLGVVYLWHDPGGWPALLLYAAAAWWVCRRGRAVGSRAVTRPPPPPAR